MQISVQDMDDLAPARYDRAFDAIRDMIIAGRLPPGEVVSEGALAAALGVSRTPVREAVRRLVGLGLVQATPRGLRVFRPTAEDVAEVYFLRAAIEGAVVRAAAVRVTPGMLGGLRHLHRDSVVAADRGDIAALVALNGDFHRGLAEAAGGTRALAALGDLEPLVAAYRRLSLLRPEHQRDSIADHDRIIGLLARRDGAAAEVALRDHVARAGRRVAEAVAQIDPAAGAGDLHLRNLDSLAAPRGGQERE